MNNLNKIFGEEADIFLSSFLILMNDIQTIDVQYRHLPSDQYGELIASDPINAYAIYWEELLGRAHMASTTSLLRSYAWIESISKSYESNNHLAFAASFRCFLEAAGDSVDGIGNVALAFAEHHKIIKSALNHSPTQIALSPQIEDQLIHYAFGRKINKEEKAPSSHSAKTATSYLKTLSSIFNIDFTPCYAELCQITHPAAHSVHHWLTPHHDKNGYTLTAGGQPLSIELFCTRYSDLMLPLLFASNNPALVTLKALRYFPITKFHYPAIDKINLDQVGLWKKCKPYLIA